LIANAHATTYHISCAPPAGTVPDPAAVCRALSSDARLLAPIECPITPDMGSELVRGTVDGRPVGLRLGASAACARRWQQLSDALGVTKTFLG
jgi:hypothetical protein